MLNLVEYIVEQEQFYGKATFNKSRAVVVDQIAEFTAKALGSSSYSAIKSGFNNTNTDHATRVAFKVRTISIPQLVETIYMAMD